MGAITAEIIPIKMITQMMNNIDTTLPVTIKVIQIMTIFKMVALHLTQVI